MGTAAQGAAKTRARQHPIEVARVFHTLEDPPRKTQADIARETGRSPGYVSTLCRVGDAIRDLAGEQLATLRQRHVTYTALATLVARHKTRERLLAAIEALAAHTPGRRRRNAAGGASLWTRPDAVEPEHDQLDPLPGPGRRRPTGQHGDTYAYTFDATEWRQDPDAALATFEGHLRELLDGVMRGARRVLGATVSPLAATSAAPLPREPGMPRTREARLGELTSLEVSLRQLEARVDATRRGHRSQMAAFEAERAARMGRHRSAGPLARTPEAAQAASGLVRPSIDEIEADLAE